MRDTLVINKDLFLYLLDPIQTQFSHFFPLLNEDLDDDDDRRWKYYKKVNEIKKKKKSTNEVNLQV